MTQTVPATAQLGPGKTGLAIGYRVLNLDGTTYAAFATTGVAETSVAGTYRKTGGVVCPDAGAYIVWGVSGTDYAEATVESTAVNVTLWKGADAGAAPAKVADLPAAAPTAAQVRTEMDSNSTKLANLDATISSRLASADYTAPLDGTATQAAAAAALTAYDPPTKAELDAAVAPLATAAALATVDSNVDAVKVITDQLDVTAVTQVAASSAGHLTITAALTFNESVTGLTIPATWVTALWTLKADASKPDTAALVQLRETNPAALTDGLVRLNGAAVASPLTAASGALTVTQASGRIGIYLTDELTALLDDATGLGWDVKFINAAGDSSGSSGTADVVLTETKATA